MEKLESSLKNMVLSLVTICLVAGGALAGVYVLTKENIEKQKEQKLQAAILQVLPEGCTISNAEVVNGMTIYKGYINDQWVGTAVETIENGFGGPIKVMVGFDKDSKVINYQVLEHQETPGLGDKMGKWFKTDKGNQNIIGKKADGAFQVSKDVKGGIDAITAATISSRAFLKAINKAYTAFTNSEVQAISSTQAQNCKAECNKECEKVKCEKCEKECNKVECKNAKETEVTNE